MRSLTKALLEFYSAKDLLLFGNTGILRQWNRLDAQKYLLDETVRDYGPKNQNPDIHHYIAKYQAFRERRQNGA